MSKYYPLNLKWRFFTREGFAQPKSLFYRIYINVFGIFFKIPILPLSFSFKQKTIDIWYKGDQIIILYKNGIRKYLSIGCEGEFNSLKEIDKFWNDYNEF
jgi:hypothetical protein